MEKFLSLLCDPAPAFICEAAGRRTPKPSPITIRVSHEPAKPAEPTAVSMLTSMGAGDLIPLYSLHDGISLFVALFIHQQIAPAFRLYSALEINGKTAAMREWALGDEEDLYDFQKRGIAIGEICFSGNYFVLSEGSVYYSSHDGGDDNPFAQSFPLFLEGIAAAPAKFLYDAGCYTRYSDGATPTQWIPEKYIPDITA